MKRKGTSLHKLGLDDRAISYFSSLGLSTVERLYGSMLPLSSKQRELLGESLDLDTDAIIHLCEVVLGDSVVQKIKNACPEEDYAMGLIISKNNEKDDLLKQA